MKFFWLWCLLGFQNPEKAYNDGLLRIAEHDTIHAVLVNPVYLPANTEVMVSFVVPKDGTLKGIEIGIKKEAGR